MHLLHKFDTWCICVLNKGFTILSNTSIVKYFCEKLNSKNYLHLWSKQLFANQMFVISIYYVSVWLAYAVAICPDKCIVGVEHQLKVKTGCLGILSQFGAGSGLGLYYSE